MPKFYKSVYLVVLLFVILNELTCCKSSLNEQIAHVVPPKINYRIVEVNKNGVVTKYSYTNNVLSRTDLFRNDKLSSFGVYAYTNGRLSNYRNQSSTDGSLIVEENYYYDSNGRMFKYEYVSGSRNESVVLSFDANNRPVKGVNTDLTHKRADELTTWEYDANDNVVKIAFLDGSNFVTYSYDAKANFVKPTILPSQRVDSGLNNWTNGVQQYSGGTSSYSRRLVYDAEGKLISYEDFINNVSFGLTTIKYESY